MDRIYARIRTGVAAGALALPIFFVAVQAQGKGDASGGMGDEVKVECKASGQSTMKLDGKEVKVNCGADTPTKKGKLPEVTQCVGSAFRCMKGKDCITIQSGYKFHKTNCGSGGKEATGAISTAGCVEMGDADFEKLKEKAGKATFDVQGPGGGSGR